MSTLVACPTCGTNLQVPTPFTPGKPMRCPSCQSYFMLTVGVAGASTPDAPPGPRRKPRRHDDFAPAASGSGNGTGKTVAYMLLGGGIVVLLLLLIGGGILGMLALTADRGKPPAQARRTPSSPSPEPPALPASADQGPAALEVGGGTGVAGGLGTASPPGEAIAPNEDKRSSAEEEEQTPAKPSRPDVPPSVSGNSNAAFDPPVRALRANQRQVSLRVAKMPHENPAQLARHALGSFGWVDKETVEVDRASKEIRFGTLGQTLRPEDAKVALEKVGFKISGATIVTPKGK